MNEFIEKGEAPDALQGYIVVDCFFHILLHYLCKFISIRRFHNILILEVHTLIVFCVCVPLPLVFTQVP